MRSEDEAIAETAPALRLFGTAAYVVEAYLPLVVEVKRHFCRPGRPRINPATGGQSRTWNEICEKEFGIGIRRMQQILASLKEPKLPGSGGAKNRRPPIDQKEYERTRQAVAPAVILATAIIKDGLAGKFPQALEILKAANVKAADHLPKPPDVPAMLQDRDGSARDSKLQGQADALAQLAGLAVEGFEIVDGMLGDRLMGSAEGNRLVEIARTALEISRTLKKLSRGDGAALTVPRGDGPGDGCPPAEPDDGEDQAVPDHRPSADNGKATGHAPPREAADGDAGSGKSGSKRRSVPDGSPEKGSRVRCRRNVDGSFEPPSGIWPNAGMGFADGFWVRDIPVSTVIYRSAFMAGHPGDPDRSRESTT